MSDERVQILLVEDNPYDEELTLRALGEYNLANEIQVARDGEEAVAYLFARGAYAHRDVSDQPRLILLDLKLPKVDGLEVLEQIKADPRTKSVPVVILTSSSQESDVLRSYELGVNSYIVKPVDFDQFTKAVRDLGFYWLLLNRTPDKGT